MKHQLFFLKFFALGAAVMCALSMQAAEAYANYTPSNTTLTFYYDNQRSSRPGTTYDLNGGTSSPGWYTDGTYEDVTKAVFNSSFADARPITTFGWFNKMYFLQSITGLEYLNTSEVTNMNWMFGWCMSLTSLDMSHLNTAKVTDMEGMFYDCMWLVELNLNSFNTSNVFDMDQMFAYCTLLTTVSVGDGWSAVAVLTSDRMFEGCTSLVGGQGTTYNASHVDKAYAHIDGGPSNPGYFTAAAAAFLRGDVDGNGEVGIADVTALIHYLLTGDATGVNTAAADCDESGDVGIADVTTLISYLLTGNWPD